MKGMQKAMPVHLIMIVYIPYQPPVLELVFRTVLEIFIHAEGTGQQRQKEPALGIAMDLPGRTDFLGALVNFLRVMENLLQ